MDCDSMYFGTYSDGKLSCRDQSHSYCHSLKGAAQAGFTYTSSQSVASPPSDTQCRCHAGGASCIPLKSSYSADIPPYNPDNLTTRSSTRMSSLPCPMPEPNFDHLYTFKFPPNPSMPDFSIPHLTLPDISSLASPAQQVSADAKIVPISDLYLQMGQANEEHGTYQSCEEAPQTRLTIGPRAVMNTGAGFHGCPPPQETISPHLLTCLGEYCDSMYPRLQESGLPGIEFDARSSDSLPGLYGDFTSPYTRGTLPTATSNQASPDFLISGSKFGVDGDTFSHDSTLAVRNSLDSEEAYPEPGPLTSREIGVSTRVQYFDESHQLPHLPENSILFDDCLDFAAPSIAAELVPTLSQSLSNASDAKDELVVNDTIPQYEAHLVNSPSQHSPRKQSKCRSGQRDTSKDEILVRCKAQGMSYKQIKELGAFEEAESTLRGRYRALTKPREARLRKPEWGMREIALLISGVRHFSKTNSAPFSPDGRLDNVALNQFVNKVPWKQVAEYMENRGTYKYGNWTVKKKFMETIKGHAVLRSG